MTTTQNNIGRDLWTRPITNGTPPVRLLPTDSAQALGLRIALEGPVTVQAQHPTNPLRPGIDGAEILPTCGRRRILVAQQAFAPRTIRRDHRGDIRCGVARHLRPGARESFSGLLIGWVGDPGFQILVALTRPRRETAGRPSVASVALRPVSACASPRASHRRRAVSSP